MGHTLFLVDPENEVVAKLDEFVPEVEVEPSKDPEDIVGDAKGTVQPPILHRLPFANHPLLREGCVSCREGEEEGASWYVLISVIMRFKVDVPHTLVGH